MHFELFLTLEGLCWYGNIPLSSGVPKRVSEKYQIEPSDVRLLDQDFVDPINDLCGTLLDDGDVDFFDANQCELLAGWLEERIGRLSDCRLAELYRILLEYANQAVSLGTGMVIEL